MKYLLPALLVFSLFACNNHEQSPNTTVAAPTVPDAPQSTSSTALQTNADNHLQAQPAKAADQPAPDRQTAKMKAATTQQSSQPVGLANKTDFICGMEVTNESTDTCHYKGKVYGFCSEYCKDTFKEHPEKYLGGR